MINKLERKFGKYAIRNLMKYVVMLYVMGFIVYFISSTKGVDIYGLYLSFNIDKILKGEVWRLVTFLIQPLDTNLFFMLIAVYLYYMIGNSLERAWGSFRFNLFYFSGVLFNIVAAVLIYVVLLIWSDGSIHLSYPISLEYINLSMFLAFATLYSEVQLLLFFVIPIKIKYLSYFYIAIEVYGVIYNFIHGGMIIGICTTILFVVSILNFIIFFFGVMKRSGRTPAAARRRREFTKNYYAGTYNTGNYTNAGSQNTNTKKIITRHKCAVCGRTELDDDDLEFRFCSKCDGNYEYCMEHLYTHTHVVREYKEQ